MYNNIGDKIKGGAIVIALIEAVIAFVSGIMIVAELSAAIGIIVMIVGIFIAYISSWLLYGFGELIQKTCNISNAVCGTKVKGQVLKNDSKISKGFATQGVMDIPQRIKKEDCNE